MKDVFYRNSSIFRLSIYGIVGIIALIFQFNATGLLSNVVFFIVCALSFPFVSLNVSLISLIWGMAKNIRQNHIANIAAVILSVAAIVLEIVSGFRIDSPLLFISSAIVAAVWLCRLTEFLVRKIKEQKERGFTVTDKHFIRNKWIFIAVVYAFTAVMCVLDRNIFYFFHSWEYFIPVTVATLFISAVTLVWELSTRLKEKHIFSSIALISSSVAFVWEMIYYNNTSFEYYVPIYILLIAAALVCYVIDLITRKKK